MRSAIYVIFATVILGLAFFGYTALQSGTAHRLGKSNLDNDPPPPAIVKPALSHNPLLPGEDAAWENYGEDGQLKSRFRAHEYTPRANGQIDVTHPVAEFFMPNHQVMKLTGKTGEMEMPESSSAPQSSGAPMTSGAPSRGRIHDVIIEIFNLLPDSKPDVPDETIVTDNVQFDNQTMLITTESFTDAAGRIVAPDQVPVHMTSPYPRRGYDFDGRGMKVRWNDKDGRLEMLEIAHGEQLTIKDASAAGPLGQSGKPARETAAAPTTMASPAPALSAVPAQVPTAPGAHSVASSAHPVVRPAKPPAVPVPYLATFSENVRITQGPGMLVTGDEMDIDFISRSEQPGPTTVPASRAAPKTGEEKTSEASAADSIATPTSSVATAPESATQPTTRPTTQPASEPVVIHWTGKLLMLPAQPNRPKLGPGDSIVELIGKPVTVRRSATAAQQGDDIRAARLTYRTSDGSLTLVKSPSIPKVILSKVVNGQIDPQSTITTDTLDYRTDATGRKVAILTGPGQANMPMTDTGTRANPATQPSVAMMNTTWRDGAKAYFAGKSQDELEIQHVDLFGDVDVKHPQLAMRSQKLALDFAPSPDRPGDKPKAPGQKREQEITRAVAQDTVHCDLTGSNGKKQTIDCQNLDVRTGRSEDGKLFARQINASGKARARDIDQDLSAEVIELTLRPAKPAPQKPGAELAAGPATVPADDSTTAPTELEKLFARDHVRVVNKEGSVATGSELTVRTEDGSQHVRLIGAPAEVTDVKQNTIQGPLVTVDQGVAHVIGIGEMHMLQEPTGGGAPKPMDARWTDYAVMAGKENRVDIFGGVEVTTRDPDGTINVAMGSHIHIDLIDKPAPATRPATAPAIAATQPEKASSADAMQLDVGKNKDVRTITIDGNARPGGDAKVLSTLPGSDGVPLREFLLKAPRIIYQMADQKGLPTRTLLVPSAGRMLMGDYRPQEKAKPATPGGADPVGGGRGTTAFQWSKELTYSELLRQAIMTGNVVVDHVPYEKDEEKAAEDTVRINSDRVTATFEPPVHPATGPATQPAGGETALQLKYLTADGSVVVTRPNNATLTAERIEYDPHTHLMTAHGAPNRFAHYQDPDPKRSMSALEMQWNTDTWDIRTTNTRSSNPR